MSKEGSNKSRANCIDWLSSYITPEWIERAGIYRVTHQTGAELVGRKPKPGENYQGVIIPYVWPGEDRPREFRLRRDIPDYEQEPDGSRKEKNKYLTPPGRGNMVYFPPGTDPAWLDDHMIEVIIVEGEKKALALARYFAERGEKVLVMALPGVWNFRGKVGIERGPQGERVTVKGVIADIERVVWRGRRVRILFDANAVTNSSVNAARRELAKELIRRGAFVRLLDMEPEEGVNGVDDFLGKNGPTSFAKFLSEAQEGKNLQGVAAFPLTDYGNAERLITRHGPNMKWNTVADSWYCWDGKRWVKDRTLRAEAWAKDTVRAIPDVEGAVAENGDDLATYARKCESRDKLNSMLSLAKSQPGVPVLETDFDNQPYLLNCLNGTLDLKTGELRPHRREDLLTKLCPVAYDPEAKAERWEVFLQEIYITHPEMIDFTWQSVGYSLIDGNPEKFLFICFGKPDTGKSTFLTIIRELLGDYAAPADIQTFMAKVNPAVYNDLADLYGARLVTASESSENDRLNDGLVKMASGNDPVTACRKYENQFKYVPGYKIWLSVNHKPIVNDSSGGMWNRLKLLPFEVRFWRRDNPEAPEWGPFINKDLTAELLAELPGILAWAVRGCRDWKEKGFRIPEVVQIAVKEYERESDVVGEFLEECCHLGDGYEVSAGDLYDAYEEWARRRGLRPVNSNNFSRKLTGKGFRTRHDRERNFRIGVGLPVKDVKAVKDSKSYPSQPELIDDQ
jgi:P4 family phage/plasmid primase-like protien